MESTRNIPADTFSAACLPGYHVCPEDQGQMVTVSWAPAGQHGCVRRIYDASDRTADYTLHPWLVDGEFEPWNGRVGTSKRGRRITAADAGRLLADAI